jgi:hypothetical protein
LDPGDSFFPSFNVSSFLRAGRRSNLTGGKRIKDDGLNF